MQHPATAESPTVDELVAAPVVPDVEVEVDPMTPIFNSLADDWARVQAVQAETLTELADELDDATETPIDLEAEVSDAPA